MTTRFWPLSRPCPAPGAPSSGSCAWASAARRCSYVARSYCWACASILGWWLQWYSSQVSQGNMMRKIMSNFWRLQLQIAAFIPPGHLIGKKFSQILVATKDLRRTDLLGLQRHCRLQRVVSTDCRVWCCNSTTKSPRKWGNRNLWRRISAATKAQGECEL